jgi:hypothetical protein
MNPVEHAITVVNDSPEDLVFVLFDGKDTLQVQGMCKQNVSRGARYAFLIMSECTPMLHVYRHGLFGLISPRTRMSSGYGFPLQTDNAYRVNIIDKDDSGNWVSVHNESQQFRPVSSTVYHVGDMILKPTVAALITAGVIMMHGIDANMYRDWRERRRCHRRVQNTEDESSGNECGEIAPPIPSPSSHGMEPEPIEERELWGIFFEQVYLAGRWALDAAAITSDDVESQEAFLFIGLPSVSLCNVVLRSVGAAEGTLVLVDGRAVSMASCPGSFVGMFSKLLRTIASLRDLPPLTEAETRWVREFLLVAGSDREITGS